jgi:hypothetical protein
MTVKLKKRKVESPGAVRSGRPKQNYRMTTHQVFRAVYTTETIFHVPKGVRLLSLDDNKNAGNVAGSWYIKWDKLIYLDKDLKKVEVYGYEFGMEKKRPHEITEEDEEEDEEEEDEDSTRKTCSRCSEESSCGNYNDDKEWICEGCFTLCDHCDARTVGYHSGGYDVICLDCQKRYDKDPELTTRAPTQP